jgi:outer membrane protein assembly factor BamB
MIQFKAPCHLTVMILVVLAISPLTLSAANNWANWRGPNYDGSVEGANPPTKWSDRENVKWKVPVPGRGSSSPIVWENQIMLLTAIDTGKRGEAAKQPAPPPPAPKDGGAKGKKQGDRGGRGGGGGPTTIHDFVILSFNLADGKERWRTVLSSAVPHEPGQPTNTYASSSAVTDGNRIYVSFGSQGIYCLDMQGKVIWSKHLGMMRTRNQFGEGASPALYKDTLIVPWDQESNSAVYALNTANGEVRWKTDRDEVTTWATPLVVEHGGRTQVVMNGSTVRSYDLATGELLWSCGGQVSNPIPCPVRQDNFVVCMTGYRGTAIYAMPLDAKGDISNSEKVLWSNRDAAPYVASPTLYKGQLYFTKERSGIMSSLDARTGKVLIPQQRLSEIVDVYASPVAAADRIYFTSRAGVTTVIRHGSTLEELAVNKLNEPVDASPAIIGDQLLIRGAENLYLIAN